MPCVPCKCSGASHFSHAGKLQVRLQRRMTCEQSMRLPFSRSSVKAHHWKKGTEGVGTEKEHRIFLCYCLGTSRKAVELLSFAFGSPEARTTPTMILSASLRQCMAGNMCSKICACAGCKENFCYDLCCPWLPLSSSSCIRGCPASFLSVSSRRRRKQRLPTNQPSSANGRTPRTRSHHCHLWCLLFALCQEPYLPGEEKKEALLNAGNRVEPGIAYSHGPREVQASNKNGEEPEADDEQGEAISSNSNSSVIRSDC